MSEDIQMCTDTYRGWTISYNPPPIPVRDCDWQAIGPVFDATLDGETFTGNGQSATAASREELIERIDEWFLDQPNTYEALMAAAKIEDALYFSWLSNRDEAMRTLAFDAKLRASALRRYAAVTRKPKPITPEQVEAAIKVFRDGPDTHDCGVCGLTLPKPPNTDTALAAIITKHTVVGGYPDTRGIARDAYALGGGRYCPQRHPTHGQ